MAETPKSSRRPRAASAPRPPFAKWSKVFLSELAATSNISAAARKAGVCTTTAYDARRNNPEFNRAWNQALYEGYELLEMELLHRMRTGELKPAAGARRGVRSFDNANAFRLLAAHREAFAKQRAINENRDAEAIVLAINAKLETMRRRMIAVRDRAEIAKAGDDGE